MGEYFSGRIKLNGKPIKWESVFPKGTQFECNRCGICCTRLELTPTDITRLKDAGFGNCIVRPGPGNPSVPKAAIRLQMNGYCQFLNDKRMCDIYANRPLVCRSYPIIPTPGFDNDLVVDLSLKCPSICGNHPEIQDSDIITILDAYTTELPESFSRALEYRRTLAEHIRAAYPAAFLPRERKTRFMDAAIGLLDTRDSVPDMPGLLKGWSDKVSLVSHEIMARECQGSIEDDGLETRILSRLKDSPLAARTDKFSKMRYRNVIADLKGLVVLPYNGSMRVLPDSPGFRLRIGKRTYGWGKVKNLLYSSKAVNELQDYLRLVVRRSNFQLTVAQVAEYIVDYKHVAVTDYSIETLILANAIAPYLDVYSRIAAVFNGSDEITAKDSNNEITAKDMRTAISNVDSQFIFGFVTGQITQDILRKVDNALDTR